MPEQPKKPRARRPRPPIAVAPLAISTENVLAVGGITPRKLRELLAAHPDVPRSRLGHTLIIEPSAFLELIERLRVSEEDVGGEEDDQHDQGDDDDDFEQPTSIEDVLARAGRERVRP